MILVTRPEPDGSALAARLCEMGFRVLVDPLMTLEECHPGPLPVDGMSAVIATSRNGLRAISKNPSLENLVGLPLFAVGEATAEFGESIGFQRVYSGTGSASGLVPIIKRELCSESGRILHLAGEVQAFDIKGTLETYGFKIDAPVVYKMAPAASLKSETVEKLASRELDDVILMSPRSAKVFCKLAEKHGLRDILQRLTYFCLSENVRNSIEIKEKFSFFVAPEPKLEAMLELLNHHRAHLA